MAVVHVFIFLLVSAVTGVGIWFTIGLVLIILVRFIRRMQGAGQRTQKKSKTA